MEAGKFSIEKLSRALILALTLSSAAIAGVAPSEAQEKPPKKIRWGVTSISASNWIPWLAKEAKIYEKNDLDVELILLRDRARPRPRSWAEVSMPRRLRSRP